jgi:UDP-2-acetamido-3-amino-2,3-dideoxy-glucuronate N-acetyltransferase
MAGLKPDTFVDPTAAVSPEATLGDGCQIWRQVHIREHAQLGPGCKIGDAAYIGPGVRLGANCKVLNQALLYEGIELEDGVFVGPQVCFTNDFLPRAVNPDLSLKSANDWQVWWARARW